MLQQEAYQAVQYARAYIDEAFHLPLNLEQLSAQAGFSKYHFIRVFQAAYAITPHQYIMEKRLRAARELLRESDSSVTEICYDVGFQSLGSFSSLFQREIGYSPRQYRQHYWQGISFRRMYIPACFRTMFGIPPIRGN